MKIVAKAPARIDFAGGTLDIYPFYNFTEYGITVSGTINLFSTAEIGLRNDKKIIICSKDINKTIEFEDICKLKLGEGFDLLIRLVNAYEPTQGFELTTYSDIPFGSGLGGSSAMAIAVSGALNRLTEKNFSNKKIIDIAHHIEVQNHGSPDGTQELHASLNGGINAIWYTVDGERVEPLIVSKKFLLDLKDSLILCYTKKSRNSGVNNWEILKRHVEGDEVVRKSILNIRDIAIDMRSAIISEEIASFAEILKKEWKNRKVLASNISTPEMEHMIKNAESAGAFASKACGAGGGGCMVIAVKEGYREAVESALKNAGAEILNYDFVDSGLKVEVFRE